MDDHEAIPVNASYTTVPSSDPLSSVASYHSRKPSDKNQPVVVAVANGSGNGAANGSAGANGHGGGGGGGESGEYQVYSIRWLMLALYAMNQMVNSILWITFAPIQPNASTYYGVSSSSVNMFAIIFMILYFPASIVATHVFSKYGLKTGIIISALCNVSCGWFRYFSSTSDSGPIKNAYWLVLFAQFCGGIGQPFSMNAPTKLASEWFSISQRDVATTIAAMSNPVGIAIGQLLPSFFVDGNATAGIPALLLTEALIATASLVLSFLFRHKPPTPPSRSQEQRDAANAAAAANLQNDSGSHVWADIKALSGNRNFMTLNVGFGIGLALFNALTTLIAQLVKPCGYDSNDASYCGAIIIGAGLFGAAIAGPIMDTTHAYNRILKVCTIAATGASFLLFAMLRENNLPLLLTAFGVMGFVVMPLLPTAMECGIECTYPIGEESSTGFLMNFGNVPSIVLTFGMGALLDQDSDKCQLVTKASITFMTLVCVMCALICCYNGGYHRLHAETAKLLPDGHVAGETTGESDF